MDISRLFETKSVPHTQHNEGAGGCNEERPNAAIINNEFFMFLKMTFFVVMNHPKNLSCFLKTQEQGYIIFLLCPRLLELFELEAWPMHKSIFVKLQLNFLLEEWNNKELTIWS